jgi:hypothetical protein
VFERGAYFSGGPNVVRSFVPRFSRPTSYKAVPLRDLPMTLTLITAPAKGFQSLVRGSDSPSTGKGKCIRVALVVLSAMPSHLRRKTDRAEIICN